MSDPLATAMALHQQGHRAQARGIYRAILATDPANAAAHHFLGLLEHDSGNPTPALEHLQRAVQSEGAEAFYWVNLGNLLKDLQRPQEAEEAELLGAAILNNPPRCIGSSRTLSPVDCSGLNQRRLKDNPGTPLHQLDPAAASQRGVGA